MNIIQSLNLYQWTEHSAYLSISNPKCIVEEVDRIILEYQNYLSIIWIKRKCKNCLLFKFHKFSLIDIQKVVRDLRENKVACSDIPVRLLKKS